MKLKSIHKELRFTPEFAGNRDLPESERVVVEFASLPSAIEADSYKEYIFNAEGRIETIRYKDTAMIQRHVKRITNLEDDLGPIDSGVKLSGSINPEVLPLVYEIREYLLRQSEVLEPGEG